MKDIVFFASLVWKSVF